MHFMSPTVLNRTSKLKDKRKRLQFIGTISYGRRHSERYKLLPGSGHIFKNRKAPTFSPLSSSPQHSSLEQELPESNT
jgi:hypothetical protein